MKNFILIISALLFFSCNSGSHEHEDNNASTAKTLSDSIYKSVMQGHDRGMAKMGEIVRYRNLAQQKKDSLSKINLKETVEILLLDSVIHHLDDARELMNKWMDEFDPNKAGNTEEEKAAFYSSEKEKVDTVEARINSSIQKAQQTLNP